jgi:hypothetical protein
LNNDEWRSQNHHAPSAKHGQEHSGYSRPSALAPLSMMFLLSYNGARGKRLTVFLGIC